jgi:hypothetical protein
MSKKKPQLEQFVVATQQLLRAVIKRESVRISQRAKIAQRHAEFRLKRAQLEREESRKQEARQS